VLQLCQEGPRNDFFEDNLPKRHEQPAPTCGKPNQQGRKLTWLPQELLMVGVQTGRAGKVDAQSGYLGGVEKYCLSTCRENQRQSSHGVEIHERGRATRRAYGQKDE